MNNLGPNSIVGNFRENLSKAIALNPNHFDSLIYYAGFKATLGTNDEIVETINKFLKYKPITPDSRSLFRHILNKVKSYTERDNPLKRQGSDMKYILKYCGEWLITATYYWRKGKFHDAFNAFQKAFSFPRNRNQAIYWYIYLVVSLLNEEYNKAIEYGKKAAELDANFKYGWQQLSKAFLFNEQYNNALESIENAIKIDKDFDMAIQLKEDIKVKIVEIRKLEGKEIGKPIPTTSDIKSIENQINDFVLLDIEKVLGEKLPEIDNLEITKKDYYWRQGPHGYIKRDNRVIALGLNTYYKKSKLDKLPESLGDLTHLEELKLIDCWELNSLANTIGKLKNLKTLDCRGCRQLKTIPESLGECINLECLDLSECFSLEKLPSTIGKLKKLQKLILKDCQSLTHLPRSLGDLTSLNSLNLENCRSLKLIPEEIINLKNLEELNLKCCRKLRYLPSYIGNMKSLRFLELKRCSRLVKIPDSIFNLQCPQIFDLSYCYNLKKLPETVGNWNNLKILNLIGCRELQELPEKICELQNLEELNLYACRKLENLPKFIGSLENLKKIELSYCESLKELPKSITDLKNLKDINLDGCVSLIKIPKNIGTLTNLRIYKLNDKRSYIYPSEYDDKYKIKAPPFHMNNQYWPSNIKKHQEIMNTKFKFSHAISDKTIQKLIQEGVNSKNAQFLAKFFLIIDRELTKAPLFKNLDEIQDDMHFMCDYKIDNEGNVVELHMHHTESIFITIFPEQLCFLKELEVIRFPNNLIESIPECITNLKFLRILDVSNFEAPTASIPISIKGFIESLENYNKFYRC